MMLQVRTHSVTLACLAPLASVSIFISVLTLTTYRSPLCATRDGIRVHTNSAFLRTNVRMCSMAWFRRCHIRGIRHMANMISMECMEPHHVVCPAAGAMHVLFAMDLLLSSTSTCCLHV
jgi:hypothetical protein